MNNESLAGLEKLNQLCLTDSEKARVLQIAAQLAAGEELLAAGDAYEPMVHLTALTNVLREDVSAQPFTRDQLQEGAPEQMDGYWQVPRLLE